jgi:predicted metalloprotease with PDZ domain
MNFNYLTPFLFPIMFRLRSTTGEKRGGKRLFLATLIILVISACSPTIPTLEYNPKGDYNLEKYIYSVDLNIVENDRVLVHLHCPGLNQETVIFHFPKTIPGTYKELDYGEMIETIEPKDSNGNLLPVEKIGKNIFKITKAKNLTSIHYWIDDTWDHPKTMRRIWAMGGTNIEENENFVINASGWFGFFDGLELVPVQVSLDQPEGMKSFSALPVVNEIDNTIVFYARDYHHLIDCPIMVSEPDTATFMVANTKVFVEAHFNGEEKGIAEIIKKEIQPSMEAVATFTDSLPVDEYHFIMYIRDGRDFMKTMQSKEVNIFSKAKTAFQNVSLFGMGALEHGNSSFYTLTEFGDSSYTSMIKRVALHEFMHIFTPLNLHSEFIGEFDYVNPKMSKHLWLYEGITEYFANLILVKSGIITPLDFFVGKMGGKIRRAAKYPEKKIPFTEMSERVFEKKYGRHYRQVYQRGALMGLLLDIEIIRLTNGEKTLKDIVLELSSRYGPNKSFNEETFFDEFTMLVHPELRQWFANYVEGTVPLDVKGGLAQIGVEYSMKGKHDVPKRILSDYGSKEHRISFGKFKKIKKVGKKDPVGFMVGDQIDTEKLREEFYDENGFPVAEGTEVTLFVKRNNEMVELPYSMKYKERKYRHRLRILKDPTLKQSEYYSIWLGQ